MARRKKPIEEIQSGGPVDLETLTQVRKVESGALAGFDATSPAAKRRAAEIAAEGGRPVLDKRVADASAMAAMRANTPQANGLTPQQQLEAGYGTGKKQVATTFAPPSPVNGQAKQPAATVATQQKIGYWTDPGSLMPRTAATGKPRQTERQYRTALSMPVPLEVTSDQLLTTHRTQSFMQPGSNNVIDPGQIVQTSDGMAYRNDAQSGQMTPMVWDADDGDWTPRDSMLSARAKDDPQVKRQFDKLRQDRMTITANQGDGLDEEQEAMALVQVEGKLNRLAKGLGTQEKPPSLRAQFDEETIPMEDGSRIGRNKDGEWEVVQESPAVEKEKTRKAKLDVLMSIKKGMAKKNPISGEVTEAPMDQVIAEYQKTMQAMNDIEKQEQGTQQAHGQQAATQPGGSAPQATATDGKGKTIYLINGAWVDEQGQSIE